jgi:hypothetical protein
LWLIEILGHYHQVTKCDFVWKGEACVGRLGTGNDVLDECHRRLYSKSRLTRWIEAVLCFLWAGGKKFWRWITPRISRGRFAHRTRAGLYTNVGDEAVERGLLSHDVEEEEE